MDNSCISSNLVNNLVCKMRIQDIIVWILFAVSLFVVGWYFFGNSPTIEQSLLVLIISYLFVINSKMSKIETIIKISERKFNALAKDFKEHLHY